MRTPIIDGQSIEQFIPANLRGMFYKNAIPQYKYAIHNGLDPYGFSTDGLVLYLPLWALKDSAFKSVDAYKHTATVTTATWQPDGRLFDGDDYISLGKPSFASDQQGTVEFWTTLTDTGANQALFAYDKKSTGAVEEWQIRCNGTTFVVSLFIYIGSVISANLATDASQFSLNTPFHLAITSNGTTIKIHIGGQLMTLNISEGANSGQWFGDLASDADSFVFGGLERDNALIIGWNGLIDEARIYNRALTAEEITRNYNCTRWRYQ